LKKVLLELLAPAKNLEQGKAAINSGADAVYIGASQFGARTSAGNSISDIANLSNYAHKFNAKVYATVNTIFTDSQAEQIRNLFHQLYDAGVDAFIVQDLGTLMLDIPKLPIFASTQVDNYDISRIKFIESLGIERIILARELSLQQIKEIRSKTKVDLEFFVFGALCVSYSGRCYISYAAKGRSANRGECAQLCRLKYDLLDNNNKFLLKNKYLLSLKDLNLSSYLTNLIDAGITSFKIEGRLKDINYVKNVTGYFRKKLDKIIEERDNLSKSSNGIIKLGFEPDLDKTFNRGTSSYFLKGRNKDISSINTPKSVGKKIGILKQKQQNRLIFEFDDDRTIIKNGDGLCYFNSNNELVGFLVNNSKGNEVIIDRNIDIKNNTDIFRNQDIDFENTLKRISSQRKLPIIIKINYENNNFNITINNIFLKNYLIEENEFANYELLKQNIIKQFSKLGNTIFDIDEIKINIKDAVHFIPISKINEIRRDVLENYETFLNQSYRRKIIERVTPNSTYFKNRIDFQANVANSYAKQLYTIAGVNKIEPAFELQNDFKGKTVMTTKYCLKYEYGICPIYQKADKTIQEPLWLQGDGHKYKLSFDCNKCEMKIIY
jgi:putative protease